MQVKVLASVLAVGLCAGIHAGASSVTFTPGPTSSQPGITSTINYDGDVTTDPAGYTSYSGNYSFDQGTPPDGGNWLSLGAGQSATITFSQPVSYVGFLWGTRDPYNYVDVYDGSTLLGDEYTGKNLSFDGGNYFNFFAGSGEEITSIELSSSGYYFETDNLSYTLEESTSATPEPSSLLLFGTGIVSLAGLVRRRLATRA
jgi:hypothetical protein